MKNLLLLGSSLPFLIPRKKGGANKKQKQIQRIVRDAEKIFKKKYTEHSKGSADGDCIFWALAVHEAARKNGRRLVLQAGSMQWKFIPDYLDDGISANLFSYMWSPNEIASITARKNGLLPEIHVWAADPETQEIIDLSTRGFKDIAVNKHGLNWQTKNPPRYLWLTQEEYLAHPEATYSANQEATMFILRSLISDGFLSVKDL